METEQSEASFLEKKSPRLLVSSCSPCVFLFCRDSFGEASRRTWCTLVTGRRTASSTKSPAIAASTVGYRSAWKLGCPRSVSRNSPFLQIPSCRARAADLIMAVLILQCVTAAQNVTCPQLTVLRKQCSVLARIGFDRDSGVNADASFSD